MTRHSDQMDAKAFWNQFVTGFYFEKVGDSIAGTVIDYESEGPPKDPVARLYLLTKEGAKRYVTVTQERLKAALQEACPGRGDQLRVVYVGDADRAAPGMTKAKLFTVEVRRPGSQTPPGPGAAVRGSAAPLENGAGSGK